MLAKYLLACYDMQRNGGVLGKMAISLFMLGCCMAGILSSPGHAADWCFVASSKNNYYYVDSENVHVHGKNITFWIVQQEIDTGKVLYTKQFTINCEDETVALREAMQYGFAGAVRDLFSDERYDEWGEIRPQSKMFAVQNILCCDSRPRKNISEYLQKTAVKKGEFRVSSEVLSDKN